MLNEIGQRLDATGLLYYHARYYDPALGRFVSADSVVPGNASGGMDGVALEPLTVDFHEPGLVSKLGAENGFGFWFQLSDDEKQKLGSIWGSANAQALNRYSYVQNNPLRWTDPSGHLGVTAHDNGSITFHLTYEEAWALWSAATGSSGAYLMTAAIVGGKAAMAQFVREVLPVLTEPAMVLGLGIGLIDLLNGSQGVDITINDPRIVNGIWVGAPTVSRQHGEYADTRAAWVLALLRSTLSAGPPTDVPESRQWCNNAATDSNGDFIPGPCAP